MKTLGLIGYPLTHSLSAEYFKNKFKELNLSAEWEYKLFPLSNIEDFAMLVEYTPNLVGLNVTIPHKTSVIKFLDVVDEEANLIGAVNCIKIKNGKTHGYNTDIAGIESSFKFFKFKKKYPALILGNGGASKAVQFYLKKKDIPFLIAGRSGFYNVDFNDISEELVEEYPMIINTTPVGMYPKILDFAPIKKELITDKNICFDLINNPTQTEFIKYAETVGAKSLNGNIMFQTQAEASWRIWNKV